MDGASDLLGSGPARGAGIKGNTKASRSLELYRRGRAAVAGFVAFGVAAACLASRFGLDAQALDPTCDAAPAGQNTSAHAGALEVVLTARVLRDAPWAVVSGLRPLLALQADGITSLCVSKAEPFGPVDSVPRRDLVAEWLRGSRGDDDAAWAELSLVMAELPCRPEARRRRLVLDLDCTGAAGAPSDGIEGTPSEAELEGLLAELMAAEARDGDGQRDEDDDEGEGEEAGRPGVPSRGQRAEAESLRQRSSANVGQRQAARAAKPRGRSKPAGAGPPPERAPLPAATRPGRAECRRLDPEGGTYVVLPCGGAADVTAAGVIPSLPWPLAADVVPDAWDGASAVVRAFGRLAVGYALHDVADALARGIPPADVVAELFGEGVLTSRRGLPADDVAPSLACPSTCPGHAAFAASVARALPSAAFPLASAAPAFADRWVSDDGARLPLPDVGFYSHHRATGFVSLARVAHQCSALESGTVAAALAARANGIVILHHDVEDYLTYALLGRYVRDMTGRAAPAEPFWGDDTVHAARAAAMGRAVGGCVARLQRRYGLRVQLKTFEITAPAGLCADPALARLNATAGQGGAALDCDPLSPASALRPLLRARYHELLARLPVDGLVVVPTGTWSPRAGHVSLPGHLASSSAQAQAELAAAVADAVGTFRPRDVAAALAGRADGAAPIDDHEARASACGLPRAADLDPGTPAPNASASFLARAAQDLMRGLGLGGERSHAADWVGIRCGHASAPRSAAVAVGALPPPLDPTLPPPPELRPSAGAFGGGWTVLTNATPSSLGVVTPLTGGDFLLSGTQSPLLDPAQWRAAGKASRAGAPAGSVPVASLPGATRLVVERSGVAEVDLYGRTRGWGAALAYPRGWGRGLLAASAAGATGVVASASWSPAATWPTSAPLGPSSQLRNASFSSSSTSDISWAGRWSGVDDPLVPSPANGFSSLPARTSLRLLRDLMLLLPAQGAPLSPPPAVALLDVDALVVASARRAAAAALGPCNVDAGAATLLASQALWEPMEGVGGAIPYHHLRWAMLPNANDASWAALLAVPWETLAAATEEAHRASLRLRDAASGLDAACAERVAPSRAAGVRALARSAEVARLYQGTWVCLLEATWWLRTARAVALSGGEASLASSMPRLSQRGPRRASMPGGGACLSWAWPEAMRPASPPVERLALPSRLKESAAERRPTDRVCSEGSRLLAIARGSVGFWASRFPELGRRWQITGPDVTMDARPAFWRDTEPMSPRSVVELLNGPLRWRWRALCSGKA